jgi:hypothetical protein
VLHQNTFLEGWEYVLTCLCTHIVILNVMAASVFGVIRVGKYVTNASNEVEVNLRPTANRPVCLGVRRPSGTRDQFFFLLEIFFRHCEFVIL